MHIPLESGTGTRAEAIFRRGAARLAETQRDVLLRFLASAKESAFGRAHGFSEIRSVAQYQARVPVSTYEDVAPYIERMRAGEERVLFDAPVSAYVQTGGTSGRSKVIPRRQLRSGEMAGWLTDISMSRELLHRDHPAVQSKRQLRLAGARLPGELSFAGAENYLRAYEDSADFRARMFIHPAWLTVLSDPHERLYVIMRLAAGHDIAVLAALPVWLLEICSVLRASAERMIRDVRDGTISSDLSPEAREILPCPGPDPALARKIEQAIEADGGVLRPRALLPELELVQCFMSGSQAQNRPLISKSVGVPMREVGLGSTEIGTSLSFPVRDEDDNLVLGIHTAFCEMFDDADRSFLAHEVEVGARYRLVLTTPYGLYRYDTQDFIEITGRDLGGAPVFRFLGRAATSDLVGEGLTEAQALTALARMFTETGFTPQAFTLAAHHAREGAPSHYELVFAADTDAPLAVADALHAALRAASVLYDWCAGLGALTSPRVTRVPHSWFDALRATLARRSDSAKTPVFLGAQDRPPSPGGEPPPAAGA